MMVSGRLALANCVAAGALVVSFCTVAAAADLTKSPPPPMAYDEWSGFYVGAHVGGATSSETISGESTDPGGVLGGLQAGYNYRLAPNWLIGIEGELSWTSASGSSPDFTSNHHWYDTLDARLGYEINRGWLIYVKGGAAWMNADYSAFGGSTNVTRFGGDIGVGVEYMFAPQWSAKAEYTYLDFGTDNIGFPLQGSGVNTQVSEFTVGVNYHFAPGSLFGRW
jgi:outer membrane autotransporter protein